MDALLRACLRLAEGFQKKSIEKVKVAVKSALRDGDNHEKSDSESKTIFIY